MQDMVELDGVPVNTVQLDGAGLCARSYSAVGHCHN